MITWILATLVIGIICYGLGFRNGKSDQLHESERTATKIAVKQKREFATDY